MESLLVIQRIKSMESAQSLSKSDALLAEYIVNHPDCLAEATAYTLAEATGTSPATVVRFCRKLGFSGFAELKSRANDSVVENAKEMNLQPGDDAGAVKSKVIDYTKMVLDQLEESLDNDALQKAADMISGANHVVILSEGGSGTIARAAYDIFLKLAIPVRCIDDIMFQNMEISMMGPDDVLLIIVNSGRTWNVLSNAAYAQERGLKIIGVVGRAGTPLSQYLDVEILTAMFSSDYFSDFAAARACELVTVSILHSIIALTRTEEQLETSHRITLALEQKRMPLK